MWTCNKCKNKFEDPDYKTVCAEDLYGVSSQFTSRNYIDILICPECRSVEIEEWYEYEEED